MRPRSRCNTLSYFDANGGLRHQISWWDWLLDRFRGRVDDVGELGSDGVKDHRIDRYEALMESTWTSGV
jgi:hypothetical protein